MRKLSLILIILLFTISLQAQNVNLSFVNTQFSTYTTHFGDSLTLFDSIRNTNTLNSFHGTVTLGAKVNNTPLTYPEVDSVLLSNTTLDSSGSLMPCAIHLFFHNPLYQVGPNVVVIWPIYNGGHAGPNDSIRITIMIIPLGIAESPLSKIYLYQGGDLLHLAFGDAQNLVQRVRIYDILGKTVYNDNPDNAKNIPTNGWQQGIYICEITSTNGERKTLRVRID